MIDDKINKLKNRLAPGLWEDELGHVHFSIPELLDQFELENTEENRAIAIDMIKEMIREERKDITILYRKDKEDPGKKL